MAPSTFSPHDRAMMTKALELAEKGAGHVSPNPMVGCVITSDDSDIIGQGYHEKYGEPHAEINALESIKEESQLPDATLYVTLEPCSHTGNTPPCADAIGELPLKRVVIAMQDPNPSVDGEGIQHLRDQGLTVDVGLMEEEARKLNEFFIHYHTFKKPFVTLKMAQTADGYIAAPDGESKWITGHEARTRVHQWRSRYDGVMVGKNTARYDNPRLTVRHVEGRQPYRIVIDGSYDLPRDLNLFSDQYEEKTIVITHQKEKAATEADEMLNILQPNYFRGQTMIVPAIDQHSDLEEALRQLGEMDIISVLVEAGQNLGSALLRQNLVDKLELFVAPKLLGGGTRSIMGLDIHHMNDVRKFREFEWSQVGDCILLTAYL